MPELDGAGPPARAPDLAATPRAGDADEGPREVQADGGGGPAARRGGSSSGRLDSGEALVEAGGAVRRRLSSVDEAAGEIID